MSIASNSASKRVVLERVLRASIADVWELWTTAEGIESFWGPDGFSVKVRKLDLRPGGELRYAMTADAPEMVAFMKANHMPVTTENVIRFTEVSKPRRLAYMNLADFIPGVTPYEVETVLELTETSKGVHLVLTLERMHDEEWTKRAVMGWEMELGKLEKVLASKAVAR
jgi:uncharacterized protein YndB with AHSA1/START domain